MKFGQQKDWSLTFFVTDSQWLIVIVIVHKDIHASNENDESQ